MLALHRLRESQPNATDPTDWRFPALQTNNFFVVQKHWATAKHYDLRLQLNGRLFSWAIPRGLLGMKKGEKRAAFGTSWHSLGYALVEGPDAPAAQQRGTMVWDIGRYTIVDSHDDDSAEADPRGRHEEMKLDAALKRTQTAESRRKKSFHIILHGGQKLTNHEFAFIFLEEKYQRDGTGKRAWLVGMPKHADPERYAWPNDDEDSCRSAKTGRTLAEVFAGPRNVDAALICGGMVLTGRGDLEAAFAPGGVLNGVGLGGTRTSGAGGSGGGQRGPIPAALQAALQRAGGVEMLSGTGGHDLEAVLAGNGPGVVLQRAGSNKRRRTQD